ncbi:MAG: phosphodiester glycosidase family protein [Candidatus Poribacteria bacterium]
MKAQSLIFNRKIIGILVLSTFQCLTLINCDDIVLSPPEVGLGLEYQHWRDGNVPWSIHILKIDRTRNDLKLRAVLAQDKVLGLSPMSSIITSLNFANERPVAGVNGDFFIIEEKNSYRGDPIGIHISDGELISEPTNISFWVDKNGSFNMGAVKSNIRVILPNGESFEAGLNKERKDSEIVIYTYRLGDSTKTNGGIEFILKCEDSNWTTLQVGKKYVGKIIEINKAGNSIIKSDTIVLSVGENIGEKFNKLKIGEQIEVVTETQPDLSEVVTAMGGSPILIQDGKPMIFDQGDRHPRTAIGWNDKYFFMVVVDGRQPLFSVGMSLKELTELMVKLGCTQALNLDGGGSSTFWLGGRVLNSCSDGKERPIANALILMRIF